MNFIAVGANAYTIKGGIQIDSCEILSNSDFSLADLPPSLLAQLRNTNDQRPIYMSTLFGKTFDITGNILPSDDINRTETTWKSYKGYIIDAQEVSPSVASSIIAVASHTGASLEQLAILRKYMNLPDITSSTIAALTSKIGTVWSSIQGLAVHSGTLTSGGSKDVTTTVTGMPMIQGTSYTYFSRLGFGTLRIKLLG